MVVALRTQSATRVIATQGRFGVCPDDVFRTSVEASAGVATLKPFGRATDRAGVGATWGQPVGAARRNLVRHRGGVSTRSDRRDCGHPGPGADRRTRHSAAA